MANAKDRVGNGGDQVALQFQFEAKTIMRLLERSTIAQTNRFAISKLVTTTDILLVRTTAENLELFGYKVDAINYPYSFEIVLNRARWKELAAGPHEVYSALVLHELLGVAGLDDTSYKLSEEFMTILRPMLSDALVTRNLYLRDLNSLRTMMKRLGLNRHEAELFQSTSLGGGSEASHAFDRLICSEQQDFANLGSRTSNFISVYGYSGSEKEKLLYSLLAFVDAKFSSACGIQKSLPENFGTMISSLEAALNEIFEEYQKILVPDAS